MNHESLALEAAEVLVAAYREGKRPGGHIEWNNLDVAHEYACQAVLAVRRAERLDQKAEALRSRRFPVSQPPYVPWNLSDVPVTLADVKELLDWHGCGEWGDVAAEEATANERALAEGGRIISRLALRCGIFLVTTDLDRSALAMPSTWTTVHLLLQIEEEER